jgi:hypothetical protein
VRTERGDPRAGGCNCERGMFGNGGPECCGIGCIRRNPSVILPTRSRHAQTARRQKPSGMAAVGSLADYQGVLRGI